MKHLAGVTGALGLVCFVCVTAGAQEPKADAAAKPPKAKHEAYFVHPDRLPLLTMIPAPPAEDSATAKAEFAELHRIQSARTPEQVKAAQADDAEEDIFIYRTVLGTGFNAQALPLTAALSAHVHGDEPVASNGLKVHFERPRPYQVDATLHPVCKVTTQHNAYPSGHTVSGYLLAFTLAQVVPEKSTEILARADDYAHNRLVCGVHTASDLEASRRIAYAVFGSMLEEPRFQKELAEARAETRRALSLNP
jgi:acid phosphatase (class A)